MNLDEFLRALQHLSPGDISPLAAGVCAERDGADDLAWWHATLALDRSVRQQRRSTSAATGAAAAARAVVAAAGHAGLAADATDVVEVARAAAEVARTFVAEDGFADPCYFRHGWEPIVTVPAWAPCPKAGVAA